MMRKSKLSFGGWWKREGESEKENHSHFIIYIYIVLIVKKKRNHGAKKNVCESIYRRHGPFFPSSLKKNASWFLILRNYIREKECERKWGRAEGGRKEEEWRERERERVWNTLLVIDHFFSYEYTCIDRLFPFLPPFFVYFLFQSLWENGTNKTTSIIMCLRFLRLQKKIEANRQKRRRATLLMINNSRWSEKWATY